MVYSDVAGAGIPHVSQDGEKSGATDTSMGLTNAMYRQVHDPLTYETHNMAMTLRPGEKIIRNWMGGENMIMIRGITFRMAMSGPNPCTRYGSMYVYLELHFIWSLYLLFSTRSWHLVSRCWMVSHLPFMRYRHGGIYDMPERAILSTGTPYTILGGKLKATFYRGSAKEWDRVSATVISRTGPVSSTVWSAPEGVTGSINAEIDLDEILFPIGERGRHDYSVEFNFMADESNDPPTQSGLDEVELVTDIQVSSYSLPALKMANIYLLPG